MANNHTSQSNSPEHNLDQQLDHALESYLPQPRAGLEQRILAHTQTITPRPTLLRPRLAFLAASMLAASALLAILFAMPGNIPAPRSTNTVASTSAPPKSQKAQPPKERPAPANLAALESKPVVQHQPIRKPHRARYTPQDTNLPYLAVFPAPAPPTPQEQELADLAARYPNLLEQARKPMFTAGPQILIIKPIHIQPLKIAPLSIAKLNPQPNHPENAQ